MRSSRPGPSVARITGEGGEGGERGLRLARSQTLLQFQLLFGKSLCPGERDVGHAMGYTALQKLQSTKYPFKKGINITGLDELSGGKMARIAVHD